MRSSRLSRLLIGIGFVLIVPMIAPQAMQAAESLDDLLNEVKIPTLPPRTRESLDYLIAQNGFGSLKAHQVVAQLQAGQALSYSILAGPTHEAMNYSIQQISELAGLEQTIKAQRERDQHRPAFAVSQGIFNTRLPAIEALLASQNTQARQEAQGILNAFQQLSGNQQAAEAALAQSELTLKSLQQDLQPIEAHYMSQKRFYDELNRLQSDYQSKVRQAQSALNQMSDQRRELLLQIKQAWDQSREEEALIWKDPNNAAVHRQRAEYFRRRAQTLEDQVRQLDRQAQQHILQRDHFQKELTLLAPRLTQAELNYTQAKSSYDSIAEAASAQSKRSKEWQVQRDKLSAEIVGNQQKQAEYVQIVLLLQKAMAQTSAIQGMWQNWNAYSDFDKQRAPLLTSFLQLMQTSQNADYQRFYQAKLQNMLTPLQYLVSNIQKPD